jgi:predicted nucleic acid-binding protein
MGELTGRAQLRGRPQAQNHTWITACFLRYQLPLVALDPAGFRDFAEYHGLVLLGKRALDQSASGR